MNFSPLTLYSELEAVLILAGAIVPQMRPSRDRDSKRSDSSDDEDTDDEPSSRMRSAATRTNAKTAKNIRQPAKDDSDSDFDL